MRPPKKMRRHRRRPEGTTFRAKAVLQAGHLIWLFADTPCGAVASARLYSPIETAKANGLEPYAYLRKVFTGLPGAQTAADIEALLPHAVQPAALTTSNAA